MKNYYEILQVSHNASKEVIEKAYKVLAKKYHPDLQKTYTAKTYAEKKLIEINEAYDVLSDDFLRGQYDLEYKKQKMNNIRENASNPYNMNENNTNPQNYNNTMNYENMAGNDVKRKRRFEYRYNNIGTIDGAADIVREMFKGAPEKITRRKLGKKDAFAIILTIIIVLLIGIILWFIPFTNSWIRQLLFENPFFDFIGGLFNK